MACVERNLGVAIVHKGAVRDLDEEQHVGRPGMGLGIKIVPVAQEDDIRLRFGEVVQAQGILRSDDRPPRDGRHETIGETVHLAGVAGADGGHVDQRALDQLDAIVLVKNARLSHLVEIIHAQVVV